ncbi:RCC1 domain-containing protein, alpha-tubulin suppressor [Acidovorax sp. CF316]|uniref:RCC1 domain-containing protein n=1 Tax=Acidovorax sp. CF316 TaxID=1144317 RepID=UPI00026BE229|nr:RCC1 domain-containing protein, alpha-tubulin suppressor [Acidovorax sp. CF316]EJE51988.1 RCC1 domain-containing protein, alpha-tubulin suppressor [Acidovorax sp. CF316]
MSDSLNRFLRRALVLAGALAGLACPAMAAIPHVVIGDYHMLLLNADGSVTSWGRGDSGQLGRGQADRSNPAPAKIASLGNEVVALTAGGQLSAAVKRDGSVWVWGNVSDGLIGANTSGGQFRYEPVQVPGLSGIVSVLAATNGYSLYATDSNGQIWAWGYDSGYGNLGLGPGGPQQRGQPLPVAGATGIVQLAVTGTQMIGRRQDGSLIGWGSNSSRDNPLQAVTAATDPLGVTALKPVGLSFIDATATGNAAGLYYGIKNGQALAWGDTNSGMLTCGQESAQTAAQPYTIKNLSNLRQIAAGGGAALFVDGAGAVFACGQGERGLLGDGTTVSTKWDSVPANAKAGPVRVQGLPGPVSYVFTGAFAAAALMPDGTVYTWGRTDGGVLGNGVTTANGIVSTPTRIALNAGVDNSANPGNVGNPGGTNPGTGTPAPGTEPAFSTAQSGPLNNLTAKAGVTLPASHAGQPGAIFVALLLSDGRLLMLDGATVSFVPAMAALYTGALPVSAPVLDINGMDLSSLAGSQLYLGYGLGVNSLAALYEMLRAGRYSNVLNLR